MAKRRPLPTVSDQLRDALSKADSLYELAKEAEVDRSVLSRFMSGERTLTLTTVDKLAKVLKLRLVR